MHVLPVYKIVVSIIFVVVDKAFEMAVSVLVVAVLLLSVSEVISECSPSSGKTLDVYNNNCIGFIGIYLMHNGDCYPNGSYFHDSDITGASNSIMCVLPGSTLNGGEWVAPSGSSVDCSSTTNPIRCNDMSSRANISLYKDETKRISPSDDGWYKCCLQAGCSDSIFANIFSKCSHCTSTHCHLLLIYYRMGTD